VGREDAFKRRGIMPRFVATFPISLRFLKITNRRKIAHCSEGKPFDMLRAESSVERPRPLGRGASLSFLNQDLFHHLNQVMVFQDLFHDIGVGFF
jgi:hypothetical protein